MGNGDIVVGKNPPAQKSASASPADFIKCTATPTPAVSGAEERYIGAMSQQRSNMDAVSTPQEFVRLVGCRDPKAHPSRGR